MGQEEIYPLVGNDLRIIQRKGLYRFGLEAVLLANFVRASRSVQTVDLGSGDGVIPLLLAFKKNLNVLGVEIQRELVEMSRASVVLNRLEDKVVIENMDIRDVPSRLAPGFASIVTANPPFFSPRGGRISPNPSLALARHELKCSLQEVFAAAAHLLKERGWFYLAHRPERLADIIFTARGKKLEPKRVLFVQPHVNKAPNIVLMAACFGGRPGLKMHPPLIVYEGDDYSPRIEAIYRGGSLYDEGEEGNMTWTVYILECGDGTLYTGITRDLKRRLQEHHEGRGARYTRGRGPFCVVHREHFPDRGTAQRRELEIKSLTPEQKRDLSGEDKHG